MITLDALRAAAFSAQPWDELDALVRAELAAGRLTNAIHDEIRSLQNTIRELPEYTDDANDAIGDTLDALSGLCPVDREYKNPPVLPTEDEIAKLPRWARVAFAARCARRVVPLFARNWPDAPAEYASRLNWGLELAEQTASSAGQGHGAAASRGAIGCAAYTCEAVIHAAINRSRAKEVIAAVKVVFSRLDQPEVDLAWPDYERMFSNAVTTGVRNASVALANGLATSRELYESAQLRANTIIRCDFDHLVKLADWQHWTEDTPVPPEVFGPLWPEGPPKEWPEVTEAPARDELALEHPPANT